MEKPKLLVFDFDGTIADTKNLYVDAIHRFTCSLGYDFSLLQVEKNLGPKLGISLGNLGVKEEDVPELREKIHKYIVSKETKIKICSDAKQGLETLHQKYKTVLLTNSIRLFVEKILKKYKLKRSFDKLMYSENFITKEDAFRKLAKDYKIKMKEILYVADKTNDVQIARKVGCRIAIVLACSWDKTKFKHERFVFRNLRELLKILGNL